MANSAAQLSESIKSKARLAGFELCGLTRAISPSGASRLSDWIDRGFAGEMHYIPDRESAYRDPAAVLDGVRSIVMLGMDYGSESPRSAGPGQGRIARYAWGDRDYHDHLHQRLRVFEKEFASEFESPVSTRTVVDTAPLLEREFAQLAGLGWFGKNTMMINKRRGSYFFLAALLTDAELPYDDPFDATHCGTCTACLEACPTDAFPEPGTLDATRCISYLTIEHRSAIPVDLRDQIGEWLFGCDICQEVCPWNRKSPQTAELNFQPLSDNNPVDVEKLFLLDNAGFRERFRKTPLWRPKRRGVLRNAAIVLGNCPSDQSIQALKIGLADEEELVRGASAWALGKIGGNEAVKLLTARLEQEQHRDVIEEIQAALQRAT